jgi:hypothetical protein
LYTKNSFDSPLNGFNSLNVNTRRFSLTRENLCIPSSGTLSHAFRINTDALIKTCIKHFSSKSTNNNLSIAANEIKQATSLVVWGTNLTSTVGMGRFTKQVRDMIKLPH